jgi:hypothetical protein
VGAHLIAIALVTTAGACHEHEPEGYDGSRDDDEP